MEYGEARQHDREHGASTAVNAEYTATSTADGILLRKLSNPHSRPSSIVFRVKKSLHGPLLAFHPIRLNLLAASTGPHLVVFDVETHAAKHVFKGNGRIITSVAFGPGDGDTLATGTADGTICVWSVKDTSRPSHILHGVQNACSHVALHPRHANLLAAVHGNCISLWRLPHLRPITSIGTKPAPLRMLTWCPDEEAQILTVSHGGIVSLYDLKDAVSSSPRDDLDTGNGGHDSDDDDAPYTRPRGTQHATSCTAFNLSSGVFQARILGQNGLVVLPNAGKDLYFYNYSLEQRSMTELWRLHKEIALECFTFRMDGNTFEVAVISENSIEMYRVPVPVLDSMSWSRDLHSLPLSFPDEPGAKEKISTVHFGVMRPQRQKRPLLAPPTSRRRKHRPQMSQGTKITPTKTKSRKIKHDQFSRPGTPISQTMTSSLELPKERPDEDGQDSPMPFLSPNIPARKTSPGLVTPLDESVQLPPLALFDSKAPVIDHGHESDSDDETFAGDMKGSGTFLPGGVNVPLPRTCGALFAPSGQLVTFFPYSIKNTVHEINLPSKSPTGAVRHGEEVGKLFPGFGNLVTSSSFHASSFDSDKSISEDERARGAPKLVANPSSFDAGPSWVVKTSPVKANLGPLPGEHRVNVSVRCMKELTPTRQALAETYELVAEEDLSNSDLCRGNAIHAEKEGLLKTAEAWRLLAILLEPRSLSAVELTSVGDMSSFLFGQRPSISRTTSMASSRDGTTMASSVNACPLLHLSFGRSWAIGLLFAWAEARVDIQLLACMSALVSRTCEMLKESTKRVRHRQSYGNQSSLVTSSGLTLDSSMFPPGVPALYMQNMGSRTAESSPNKVSRSRLSSGNPSQSTTPYLDSSNSTPPLTSASTSRQNIKLSASGSASPEHHRSSFGAAAKNYAASIAEKFGSYGSSPPTRKLGTSPGNELSSSLPTAAGSWSKSVSFASTMEQSKNSQHSLSLAQEDDNYDSDRTVEDNSVPNTPKRGTGGVSVTKKKASFFHEKLAEPIMQSHLMSEELASKACFWRQQYAEQLLSWEMLTEAAEMEVVTPSFGAKPSNADIEEKVVARASTSGRQFNDCSVCFCIVQAAEQVCPACFHVTHAACLEEFLDAIGTENFTCPTGCGCDCTFANALSFAPDHIATDDEEFLESKALVKKRPSLTDPLRLRQRLQGESW